MKLMVRSGLVLVLAAFVGTAVAAEKTKTVQGKVTSVAADSLTISHGSDTMTFTVDSSTKVMGKGIGTMMREKKAKNEPFGITDAVATDDMVRVSYHEADGKMHAAQVTVTQKSLTAKKP
jgi:hypothetical protein